MTATGIIFSNIHDSNIFELTHIRSVASIPFGCRYRMVDFALSNFVNSGITDIKIITHYNYHSLMDHIGSGKDWDLARRSGGVKFLPPFITAYANNSSDTLYRTRLEALKSVNYSISAMTSDYVILTDCDIICNLDLNAIIDTHIKSGADATFVVKRVTVTSEMAKHSEVIVSDGNDNIIDMAICNDKLGKEADINLNVAVVTRKYLQEVVMDSIAHGYTSLTNDVLRRGIGERIYKVFHFEGEASVISSFSDYFDTNMMMIRNENFYNDIFNIQNRPIYTKVRNSAPTYYGAHSFVRNSLIADGCIIEGSVENSILFRGVKVGKDAVIMNSILFQDTYTGENVTLQYVVSDKNVVIRDGVSISGHKSMPVYIDKGRMLG